MSGDEDNCRLDDERMATVNQNLCLDMLKVADGLLSVLCEHRNKTGLDLHARIGIATGEVISGVLGLLQPRFCVFGEGMCRAAELEQTGPMDAVHCTEEFLDYVDGTQDMVRRASVFNADIRYKHIMARPAILKAGQLRRKFKAAEIISRMTSNGRLHKQQINILDAAPARCPGWALGITLLDRQRFLARPLAQGSHGRRANETKADGRDRRRGNPLKRC